jgi:phage tail sheath protein FI
MAYRTPDVYVEEISTFPPSVAEVETAIPAFIGYTEIAKKNKDNDLILKPTKIYSLKEYEQYCGDRKGGDMLITVNAADDKEANGFTVSSFTEPSVDYLMYYSIKMFFDNGGGKCYIISVGIYQSKPAIGLIGDKSTDLATKYGLSDGLNVLALEDEPTLIVIPEAVKLTQTDYSALAQTVLLQCNKLRDRFAIFDIYNGDKDLNETPTGVTETYLVSNRDYFGNNYLKYGSAYYPFLKTTMNFYVEEDDISSNVKVTPPSAAATARIAVGAVTSVTISDGGSGYATAPTISFSGGAGKDAAATATVSSGKVTDVVITNGGSGYTTAPTISFSGGAGKDAAATARVSGVIAVTITNGGSGYTSTPTIAVTGGGGAGATATATVSNGTVTAVTITNGGSGYTSAPTVAFSGGGGKADLVSFKISNTALYNFVKSTLKERFVVLPPSGAVAGVYAATDTNRGVWKAPANVSLANVIEPVVKFDNAKQDDLNVDATTGKSINALRAFAGKGTLVWGARTLAGNDNEWRYVSVRRFFNMVEESVKKSTYWAVFEPNDANTWVKVRGMIENYLTQKWREGALAGATTKDAFFVKCGLGTTMVSQDILEGRMNVEIGMAVVRPAEFIILKFSHKLQNS